MERFEESHGSPTIFHVVATVSYYRRNRDHYSVLYRAENETLESHALDELYEDMAYFRFNNEMVEEGFDRERQEVEFGTVYESVASEGYNMSRLEQTKTWQDHLARVEAKAEAKKKETLRVEAERVAKVEADEKALLASLLAKHGR